MENSLEIIGLRPDMFGDIDEKSRHVTDLLEVNLTVDADTLAGLTGISDRKVRDLAERGIMARISKDRYDLARSIAGYTSHLREMAAGRSGEDNKGSLTAERIRLAKEQADAVALKNAAQRKELIPAKDVEREWTDTTRRIRAGILAAPERLRSTLPHLSGHDIAAIDAELRGTLETLADDE